ncbi:uncharacterized protein [Primulina huaijiensis]|uniref:uncharacterized protein n=1 Tax=Primulina huaijiensis TaxID=1492673 RepID=UPI003CC726E7
MASESFVQAAIPRFDGHYDHWSMLMENFLRSKEYWQVIEGGVAEPAGEAALTDAQRKTLEELKLKDLKAKNYLFQAIDRSILETILHKDTSKQIWDSMKKKFQGSAKAKRQQLQALRTEFENLRMKNTESVSDYFSRTLTIVNKMRIHGEKIEDTFVVEKILRSMAKKFNYVVCSIEEAHDLDTLSLDELQGSLMVHEQKMGQEEDKQEKEEKALQATTNNPISTSNVDRENWKNPHKKPEEHKNETSQGRWRGRDNNQANGYRPKNVDKSNIECYRCHRYGHYQYECRTNMNKKHGQQSNFAETEEDVSLLMACHGTEETHTNMWYLDTGCSNHMCGDKSVFSELDESFRNTVKFGDNSTVHVMDLRANLLSIGQLQEKGYEFVIKDGVCRIQEFIAATSCACQASWLKKILEELQFKQHGATTIFCDNSSAIKLSKNPVLHGRSKHIDVRYHFLRDMTNDGLIDLVYCKSEDQVADVLTKPLKLATFLKLRKLLGVCTLKESTTELNK